MQFKVNDGKVPYIMVAGSDYVSGEMPVETAESIYAAGEPKSSDQFKGYPVCVDNKYFFACLAKADFHSLSFRYHLPVGKPFHEAYG